MRTTQGEAHVYPFVVRDPLDARIEVVLEQEAATGRYVVRHRDGLDVRGKFSSPFCLWLEVTVHTDYHADNPVAPEPWRLADPTAVVHSLKCTFCHLDEADYVTTVGPPAAAGFPRLLSTSAATVSWTWGRVYLSMTTTPRRLRFLPHVLGHLDLSLVAGVLLHLPATCKGRAYGAVPPLPPPVATKLVVHDGFADIGPATKLLEAFMVNGVGVAGNLVITLDDDTRYPPHIVAILVDRLLCLVRAYRVADPRTFRAAVGTRGNWLREWGVGPCTGQGGGCYHASQQARDASHARPYSPLPFTCGVAGPPPSALAATDLQQVDVVEGFGAVLHTAATWSIEVQCLARSLLLASAEARASDDYVLSAALHAVDVPRFVTTSVRFPQYMYGFGPDALHMQQHNAVKYQAAAQHVDAALRTMYASPLPPPPPLPPSAAGTRTAESAEASGAGIGGQQTTLV